MANPKDGQCYSNETVNLCKIACRTQDSDIMQTHWHDLYQICLMRYRSTHFYVNWWKIINDNIHKISKANGSHIGD